MQTRVQSDPDDWLTLDRQVCFRLHAAARALDDVYRRLLRDLGLTYPQYLVMIVLWERGPQTLKQLGLALRLDSGTLSPLVKRLEAAGLVLRERGLADERSVLVRPTPQGAGLRARAREVPRRVMDAIGLDLEETREFGRMLERVTASLDAAVS
jgi:DNA-binding MarR family transcriptional regulator